MVISSDIRNALAGIVLDMEAGRIVHVDPDKPSIYSAALESAKAAGNHDPDGALFNQNVWMMNVGCGTIHCIGGLLEYRLGRKLLYGENHDLIPLFWPKLSGTGQGNFKTLTVQRTANAVRRMLSGVSSELWWVEATMAVDAPFEGYAALLKDSRLHGEFEVEGTTTGRLVEPTPSQRRAGVVEHEMFRPGKKTS